MGYLETENNGNMIPDKSREEWKMLVNGQLKYKFRNLVLQMKIFDYSIKVKNGQISETQAIDELYDLCLKYKLAVARDIKEIFKEW